MPSDPRLESALKLVSALGKLRAAEDWNVENVQAAEDTDESPSYFLTVTLRWEKDAGEDLQRHIL